MKVKAIDDVYIRHKKPSKNAKKKGILFEGFEIEVVRKVEGEGIKVDKDGKVNKDGTEVNNIWYEDKNGDFLWSGLFTEGQETGTEESQRDTSFDSLLDYNRLVLDKHSELPHNRGEDVTVAVLDSGIFKNHSDLKPAFTEDLNDLILRDFTNSAIGPEDKFGHGTHIAGIIGARTEDNIGIIGIAPKCKLVILKVTNDDNVVNETSLKPALEWILSKEIEIDLINMSFSVKFADYQNMESVISKLNEQNVITVGAGGNNDKLTKTDLLFPAMDSNIISVGAIEKKFIDSNPSFNQKLDIMLSLKDITSTSIKKDNTLSPTKNNKVYAKEKGSSVATAFVSGIVALLISSFKTSGSHDLKKIKSELRKISTKFSSSMNLKDEILIKPE
jgi:subtilisin family serine protease